MTKKRLKKKDMHILKIQGNSKYCKQQGNWNCEDCYIIGPICTNQKFYKKHISKKHKISCHNLFLLGKRKPTWYLTLQEDHNVSNYGLFYFGPVIPNMDISSKPPPWTYADFSNFGPTCSVMENSPQSLKLGKI